jgi:hypothetical protein
MKHDRGNRSSKSKVKIHNIKELSTSFCIIDPDLHVPNFQARPWLSQLKVPCRSISPSKHMVILPHSTHHSSCRTNSVTLGWCTPSPSYHHRVEICSMSFFLPPSCMSAIDPPNVGRTWSTYYQIPWTFSNLSPIPPTCFVSATWTQIWNFELVSDPMYLIARRKGLEHTNFMHFPQADWLQIWNFKLISDNSPLNPLPFDVEGMAGTQQHYAFFTSWLTAGMVVGWLCYSFHVQYFVSISI